MPPVFQGLLRPCVGFVAFLMLLIVFDGTVFVYTVVAVVSYLVTAFFQGVVVYC